MTEVVGAVASVVTLVEVMTKMERMMREGRYNLRKRHPRLIEHVNEIKRTLNEFPEMPLHVLDRVSSEINGVISGLESINNSNSSTTCSRCPSMVTWICYTIHGSCIRGKLDELDDILQKLHTQYLLGALASIKNDMKKCFPTVANENPHLPSFPTGLDRVHKPLQFLEENKDGLRIVGIHGQGGIGKTTLLNKMWDQVSSKPPFTARAYVVSREDPTPQSLCLLQSNILEQLGVVAGEQKFPSPDFGKGELKKHLLNLKVGSGNAVFLAIDNVWESVDLEDLLPDGLASLLPPSSCIAVTSRQSTVIQTLVDLCPFQLSDHSHVLSYLPECLSLQQSLQLFAQNAGMSIDDHPELLHAIVPLCGGLPLALKVLGSLFISKARREEPFWKAVCAKMHLQEASFPAGCQTVFKTLQLSYDRLEPNCQEAFLEVVGFFHGWEWFTVEHIVGKDEMCVLKDRSLLTEAEDTLSTIEYFGRPVKINSRLYNNVVPRKLVMMHGLILKFGKCLLEKKDRRLKISEKVSGLSNVRHSPHKNRFLWNRAMETEMIQPIDLQRMKNLRFLYLDALPYDHFPNSDRLILNVESGDDLSSSSFQEGCAMLRFVSLENITSNELIKQTMMSQELRQLHLLGCKEIVELPSSSIIDLKKLEVLRISFCCSFRGLPENCGNWEALQELHVSYCDRITELPATLGTLPNLQALYVERLQLTSLPPLIDMKKLIFLRIVNCPKLVSVPALPKPLKILFLRSCDALEDLPDLECLQSIYLIKCTRLQNLPTSIGHAMALKILHVRNCRGLLELPESLCNMTSLESLFLHCCFGLLELPKNMGNLKSLKSLDLCDCSELKRLPKSICNITSLEILMVHNCSRLLKLPQNMGNIKSLRKLEIFGCSELKGLPNSICNITSLEVLKVSKCFGLLELPEDMGNLMLLKCLDLSRGSKLKMIPNSICNITSLESLSLYLCYRLLELPQNMGNLKSLKNLNLFDCSELKMLPNSICNITSLVNINITECAGLLELPEDMGNLKSLKNLDLFGCSKLKRLPESICNITSLEILNAPECSWML